MNMVSSNINQWTLLAAMLPIVFSLSKGAPTPIPFDTEQEVELLLTLAQALLGTLFLLQMRLMWWEAAGLFTLWFAQFALSTVPGLHAYFTVAYFVWAAVEIGLMLAGKRKAEAFPCFAAMWKRHVRPVR
jgi:hypothetical protein